MCLGRQADLGCNKYNSCNQSRLLCHKHGILGCLLEKYKAHLVRQEDLLEGRCLGDHLENHLGNHLEEHWGFLTDCRRHRKENHHLSMWLYHHRVLDLYRESRGLRSQ